MAQLYDSPQPLLDPAHLQRYLPPDLAAAMLNNANEADSLKSYQLEAFIHLAAARYTITTYLPRLVVQQLLHQRFESPWMHQVDGSLLFADLSGSTALAERLSALGREGTERVTEFLNDIFSTMIGVIEAFGGDLIAFGGDALLVFFGDDRHPRTAARAALALQDALHGYERAVPAAGRFPMHLHIGIESGPVLFASAGLPHARHCCVLGATVNAVAAAEGQAGPGEVVAGPHAAAALASFATGSAVAPGFLRLERSARHADRTRHSLKRFPPV